MKNNICKFNYFNCSMTLETYLFVCERNNKLSNLTSLKNYALILITNGEGEFCYLKKQNVKVGSLIFIMPNNEFYLKGIDDTFEYYYICFGGERAKQLTNRFNIDVKSCVLGNYSSLIPFFRTCLIQANDDNIDLLGESAILYAFSMLKQQEFNNNDVIDKVLDYLQENYTNPSLTLESVAKEVFYNPKYVSSMFKKQTNVGFNEYLQELRMKNALFLIEQGLTGINNIAVLSGYIDPLYFSKLFKKRFGVSPKNYIKNKG